MMKIILKTVNFVFTVISLIDLSAKKALFKCTQVKHFLRSYPISVYQQSKGELEFS